MSKIKLSRGKWAIVDDEDFEFINQWKWHMSDTGYAKRNRLKSEIGKYKSKSIKMHRVINNTPDGLCTDHINRNKLDNRKCNLRTLNKTLNGLNRGVGVRNKSSCNGVHFDSWTKKWRAEIKIYGKRLSLGRFLNINDAITARKKAEHKILWNMNFR